MNILAEDFCNKAKSLSENLLKNQTINDSRSPELKEFKYFLKAFLKDYRHIKRYGDYEALTVTFLNLSHFTHNYRDANSDMEFQEIFNKYFANILNEYYDKYAIFLKGPFSQKLKHLKQQLNREDLKEISIFLENMDRIYYCNDMPCYPLRYSLFIIPIQANYNTLINYRKILTKKGLIYYFMAIEKISKDIVEIKNFESLSLDYKENLLLDIKEFTTELENNYDIENLVKTFDEVKIKFLKKYINGKVGNLKDQEILNEILKKYLKNEREESLYDLIRMSVIDDLIVEINYLDLHLTERFKDYEIKYIEAF